MPRVRFQATPNTEEWQHANDAVVVEAQHGDTTTTKIRGDGVLKDGDIVEMTHDQVNWCRNHYPRNFTVIDEAPPEVDPDNRTRKFLDRLAHIYHEDYDPRDYDTKADVAELLNGDD